MLLLSIFQTIEFYIITAFIAAAVVGFAAMPSRRDAARTFLYAGQLIYDAAPSEPGIVLVAGDDASVMLYRFGLEGVGADGAYSLVLTQTGFDITIEERLTAGHHAGAAPTAASVRIDCLGCERYHFRFISKSTGRSAAFYLTLRPDARVERLLT